MAPSSALPSFDSGGLIASEYKGCDSIQVLVVTDKHKRNRDVYISTLLKAGTEPSGLGDVHLAPDVTLTCAPTHLFYFIPGNPGVAGAYIPWLSYMCASLGPRSLVIFSGHLGHLTTATLEEQFTCEQNIDHQHRQIKRIMEAIAAAGGAVSTTFAGHSAGAYFILHGVERCWRSQPAILGDFKIILYCGTLIQFGALGRLKAMIAASPTGLSLLKKLRESKWMEKRIEGSDFRKALLNEIDDPFLEQVSNLTRDELERLPNNVEKQIALLKEIGKPVYFLMAEKDSYVPAEVQKKYLESFGADHVYIARDWWHAFVLHSDGFVEASDLTVSIIEEGEVPEHWQQRMKEDVSGFHMRNVSYGFQSMVASTIVQIVTLPKNVRNLMCGRPKPKSSSQ